MGGAVSGAGRSSSNKDLIGPDEAVTAEHVKKTITISRSGSFKNQLKAANSFCRIANCNVIRDQVIEEGGLLPLIQLFSSKSSDVQVRCMVALKEFCKSERCRKFVFEHDGCSTMLEGLQNKQSSVREATLGAVDSLTALDEAACNLVERGISSWLLAFVKESSNEIEILALRILLRLSKNAENRQRMIVDNCIEETFNTVHSSIKSNEVKTLAIQTLAELCKTKSSHERVYRLNGNTGIQRLVALIAGFNEDIAMHAAESLWALATKSSTLRKQIMLEGVLTHLRHLLKSKTEDVQKSALSLLSSIAPSTEYQSAIIQAGLTLRLIRLCSATSSPHLVLQALQILLCLAQTESNHERIVNNGGYKAATRCSSDKAPTEEIRGVARELCAKLAHLVEKKLEKTLHHAVRAFKNLSAAASGSPKALPAAGGPKHMFPRPAGADNSPMAAADKMVPAA